MPRAGFFPIGNTTIRFGGDGHWYADGERIANRRIAALFSRHLHRAVDGSYRLRIADEEAPVMVDDTPYVVTGVDTDAVGAMCIELNDGTREALAPESLTVGADDVMYCRVKGGSEPARFLRPAYYQLARYIVHSDEGFVFAGPQGRYRIGCR